MRRDMTMWQLSLAMVAGATAAELTSFVPPTYGLEPLFLICLGLRRFAGAAVNAGFVLGAAASLVSAVLLLHDRLDPRFEGDSILTRIEIAEFPSRHAASVSFLAMPIDDSRLPRRLLLRWRKPPAMPRAGDTWEVILRLRVPRGRMNPGGRDREAALFRDRVGATGYVVPGPRNRLLRANGGGILLQLRQSIAARIVTTVDDRDSAAVLVAISVGARHLLSRGQWERYARTGTSHLMAISGLHVGLAGGFAYVLVILMLATCRARGSNRRAAGVAAAGAAGAYTALSGFGVPAVRAFTMLAVATLAMVSRRPADAVQLLALAAVLVILGDPAAAGSAGFVLSFTAVACLVWLARAIDGAEPRRGHLASVAVKAWRMQYVLLVGLLPFTLLLFGRVSLAAPLVNLVVVPVFSFVTVPAVLAGMLLDGPAAPLGDALFRLSATSISVTDRLIAFGGWPEGRHALHRGASGWLLAFLAAAWALLPRGWPGRLASLPAFAAVLLWQTDSPRPGCFRLNVLDVGQGQAVVVETARSALLYDTGPGWRDGGHLVDSVVRPVLEYRGIDRLDVTVISHADIDHAGGWPALQALVPTGRLLAGEPDAIATGTPVSCHRVRPWVRDGVQFRFLRPAAAARASGNNLSCVLEVSAGNYRALLTGDIERPVEEALVRAGHVREATIVTVPHHGSRTSSSTAFIHASRPELAVVSAAYGNRWGMPTHDVVHRWVSAGARVYTTAADGALIATLCDDGIETLRLSRRERRRIWRSP